MSSCYVKLRAGNKQRDEPRVQRIIFDCSIQQLRKDLEGRSVSEENRAEHFYLSNYLYHHHSVIGSHCYPVY